MTLNFFLNYYSRTSPANPHIPSTNKVSPENAIFCDIPVLFFLVVVAAGVAPVAVTPSVPNNAGFDAVLIIVVTTETIAGTVVAGIVVGDTTIVVSTVETGVDAVVVIVAKNVV